MKKLFAVCLTLTLTVLLAACGTHKNALDDGAALFKQGDCIGAQPYLDATIASPDDLMDLAYAYFLKAKCAEKNGDISIAYENYYATKVVTCYAVEHDTHVNLNTYARNEYCDVILPNKLKELESQIGDISTIKAKVDKVLHARYLERFAKTAD